MKKSEIFFGLIRIPVDVIMALSAFFTAYEIRRKEDLIEFIQKPDLSVFPPLQDYLLSSSYSAAGLFIILGLMGMYSLKTTDSIPREIRKIIFGTAILFMAIMSYYFFTRSFPFSRLILGYSAIFMMFFVTMGRLIIRLIQAVTLSYGIGKRRVVLLGEGAVAESLSRSLQQSGRYDVKGVIHSFETLLPFLSRHAVEEVIQTKEIPHTQGEDILNFCREHHVQYHFVPSILEVQRTNVEVANIGGIPLISLRPTRLDGWGKVLKRTSDIVFSGAGLILISPFLLIIATAIKIDSAGPVFFRYLEDGRKVKRIGQYGKKIECLKFRTMRHDSHGLRYSEELAEKNTRKDSPLVKIKNDPRVTRVGKFLRKYSLDELPQLWNVLRGEMSLVGPRPHLPEEVEKYQRHHKFVLTIKPGITGLAQVSGRSDLSFETEIRLDTYYIENWTSFLDLKILFKTLQVVLKGHQE
ncbi:MAG: hypothetical protein UY05_C0051G0002 [Candidatus Peregrinibacteria bacterium GW2011_GWA2_47_7]|nr:MAG: hypothetical protein UY05_C0051G0002 [Candidatus Peregrinibacteria bacterium GW2011_GWA2_47_7]